MPLTDREQAILDFERSWWTQDGIKDLMVQELFHFTSADYYQALNVILDNPDSLDYDPLVVRRLRRLRDRRRRARLSDAAGGDHR